VLSSIAREKDASVAANVEFLGGAFQWNVIFGREIHDWEVEVVTSFYQRLQIASIRMGAKINCGEIPLKREGLRSKISSELCLMQKVTAFLGRVCGGLRLPQGQLFFVWSAALGKILTLDNLRKRQVVVVNRCYMCKKDGESVDHLLLHCEVAHALWCNIFSWLGLSWVMPSCVSDLCACRCSSGRTKSDVVWKMGPICYFWTLWRERNNRCFKDVESSMEAIIASFLYPLYLWTAAYLSPSSIC
jgi:hypothetical protein